MSHLVWESECPWEEASHSPHYLDAIQISAVTKCGLKKGIFEFDIMVRTLYMKELLKLELKEELPTEKIYLQ